ncbi:MAG: hypothetical protein JWM80_2337 [Cyanobacteria bacterium RYN_339]|nr:hypothetical protein [Cyanobacteria bacterium RYN_339]
MSQDSFKSQSTSFTASTGGGLGGLDDLELDLPPAAPPPDSYQQNDDWQAGASADGELGQDLPLDADADAYGLDAYATEHGLDGPVAAAVPAGAAWEAMLEEEFTRKDKNGDGFLSMKEISIKELLELDVDHNGFISIDEFYAVFMKKTEATFLKQDLDRDSRLKRAEFFKGAPSPELEAEYLRFASQPDKGLTLDEFRNQLASQRDAKKR